MITLNSPGLVTGAIITKHIFGIKGIGRYYVQPFSTDCMVITLIDVTVAQAVFFIFATLVIYLILSQTLHTDYYTLEFV